MIKLENISKKNDLISMKVLPSGKQEESFSLVLDANTLEEVANSSGESSSYSGHARIKIYYLLQESSELPTETYMHWY